MKPFNASRSARSARLRAISRPVQSVVAVAFFSAVAILDSATTGFCVVRPFCKQADREPTLFMSAERPDVRNLLRIRERSVHDPPHLVVQELDPDLTDPLRCEAEACKYTVEPVTQSREPRAHRGPVGVLEKGVYRNDHGCRAPVQP